MAASSGSASAPMADADARSELQARAKRGFGAIPAEQLVELILNAVPADAWPVRVEALEALRRRWLVAKRDELKVLRRPANSRVLGYYETGRNRSNNRPYRTLLLGVEPIAGRCDCPDFQRNSLGLCKHLMVVLERIHGKPSLLAGARKEQARRERRGAVGLAWDPIRPLTGFGDWMERITWTGPANAAPNGFRPTALGDGPWVLDDAFDDDPERRLALVEKLLAVLPKAANHIGRDPALAALLTKERDRIKRMLAHAPTPAERGASLRGLKRRLYDYQRAGVSRFLATGRLVLADDMGLGKTAQAIACCDVMHRLGKVKRGLIIAPASLKPQWSREWGEFSKLPIQVVDGPPEERRAFYQATKSGFLIINYEQLLRDFDAVAAWNPDLIVLDEAQRIKNWTTKSAMLVKQLNPPFRLVLTGTPMENRIDELASVVEWVDDSALEPKWRLASLHSIRADGKKEVVGVRHLETIRARLEPCFLRRIRQEVLDQLPPRTDTRIPIELTEEQIDEHDALNQPIAKLIQRANKRPLTQPEFLRLMSLLTTQRVISNGLAQVRFETLWPSISRRPPEDALLHTLSTPKLFELRSLIQSIVLEQGRKVVVFSQWRRMLALAQWAVSDLLAKPGLKCGSFTGAEGQRRRTQNLVEFHDDPSFRILFASDAGGVGLNLQRASNCVINLELPWNPAVLEQRIGRIYRLGQPSPIDVFNLVSEYGIESRIAGLVGAKQAFFKGLFDGDSDSVQFEQSGSFLERVQKLCEPQTNGEAPAVEIETEGFGGAIELDDSVDATIDDADETAASAPPPSADAVNQPARADGVADTASASDADRVESLLSSLQIRREPTGRVVIEAEPDAADALRALFEGMARILRASS